LGIGGGGKRPQDGSGVKNKPGRFIQGVVRVERSLQDESFRQRLLADPKATIEQELERKVLKETPDTLYMVLPPGETTGRSSNELSDLELDFVTGGQSTPHSQHLLDFVNCA
jgi:hypothetical protein